MKQTTQQPYDLKAALIELLGEPLPDNTPASHPTTEHLLRWERGFKYLKVHIFKDGKITLVAGEKGIDEIDASDTSPNLTIPECLEWAERFDEATQFELSGRLCRFCDANPCVCKWS